MYSLTLLLCAIGSVLSQSTGYNQQWIRGEGPPAHPHEGIKLRDGSGWVTIGDTLPGEARRISRVMIRAVDNEANTKWTVDLGDDSTGSHSAGYSIIQGDDGVLYAGMGLWQHEGLFQNHQVPAVVALDPATGTVLWTTLLGEGQSGHGGARSCIMDNADVVCAGYVGNSQSGFVFVADEATPAVWRLSASGDLITETFLEVEGMGQVAKIRKDISSGFVVCSTSWGVINGRDKQVAGLVKLTDNFEVEWNKGFGVSDGASQVFDMVVDYEGNYLLGGHTTGGEGVVNWDYLAIKVNSEGEQVWRRTYGQPRGFDPRWIHDEMYSVGLDGDGNYILLGGSGDEYPYSEEGSGEWSGWMSDTWGSYLVIVTSDGETLGQNFYGDKEGNNAGEWMTYDRETGDIMVYLDSDTVAGFGYLKLTRN